MEVGSCSVFFLNEFIRRAEILAWISRVAHNTVHLMGKWSQRSGTLGASSCILGETQILGHESSAKSTLIVIRWRHIFHHTWHGIIGIHGPTSSRGWAKNLGQEFRIQTQAEVMISMSSEACSGLNYPLFYMFVKMNLLHAEVHSLRHANHRDS